jgi:hemerythrin-like domain-containing protein
MSSAIDNLMHEHRLIERVLDALERFASETRPAGEDDRAVIGRFVEFFRTFSDRCHHGKEEDLLFAELRRYGLPAGQGPIAVMLEEHDVGRELVGRLSAMGSGDGPLTGDEREQLGIVAADYAMLLRLHIQKEDQILYPMALNVLPVEALDDLARRFERFEREEMGDGVHERMHALADTLYEC